jgi:hypothetical protein
MDQVEGQSQTEAKAETTNATDETQANAQAQSKQTEPSMTDLMARLERLESSKERLENESKKWKSRYKELEQDNQSAMQKRLEEEGKYQELLELERQKRTELETQVMQTKKTALQKELRAQVANLAKDAFDIEDVVKNLDHSLIEIDEEKFTINGLNEAVAKVKESKSYLFERPGVPGQMTGRPNNKAPQKKQLHELTKAEKDALLRESLGL